MKSFLIDECLTPDIVAWAHSRGFAATHVVYNNARDFLDARFSQIEG